MKFSVGFFDMITVSISDVSRMIWPPCCFGPYFINMVHRAGLLEEALLMAKGMY